MPIRQPIVCVLGHIDSGKTSLLDKIRKSSVGAREVGRITQHIGASYFPVATLKELIGPLLKQLKVKILVPGLLVIDTPGHEAFVNLRKRGGAVADIAILVVDVLRGFETQTYECVDILKARKTPFLVAANKVDRISGWVSKLDQPFLISYKTQDTYVRQDVDEHLYTIIGAFSIQGLKANCFDRIDDFTKTVAIVPTSAKTGEGIPELISVLIGLTQQHLQNQLKVTKGPARGTIIEVKEEPGLGVTINAIIYDGVLHKGDALVLGGKDGTISTKVRAVLLPKPLDEIRDPRDKFSSVKLVSAASGVKIVAPDLENTVPGAPLYVVPPEEDADKYVKLIYEELEKIKVETDIEGVVLKTDALGSLEAIAEILKQEKVPLRLANIGDVSKRDVTEATVVKEREPLYGAILAFNVKILEDAREEARNRGIQIFQHNIIYHLIADYTQWMKNKQEERLVKEFEEIIKPGMVRILPGYIFRNAKPAIFGVEVLAGTTKPKYQLVNAKGEDLGEVSQIQETGKAISEATAGMQVALSMEKPIVGRNINEGDVLYVKVRESHAKAMLTKFETRLTPGELDALNNFVNIMRKKIPFWAA